MCGPEEGRKLRIAHPQGGLRWLLRAVISFAAMGWAMGAQVYPLRKAETGPGEAHKPAGGAEESEAGAPGG